MALQLFDGFEILPNLKNNATLTSATATSNPGRTGGKALGLSGAGGTITIPVPTPAAVAYCGFAFKESGSAWGSGSSGVFLVSFAGDSGATTHVTVKVAADGRVEVRRGNGAGTVIGTSVLVLSVNVWHYMEVEVIVSDAGGVVVVRVDNVEYLNLTAVDTKNGGTLTTVSTVALGQFNGANYDDFYFCDGTGAAPYNTFLGDRVVRAGRPDGAGASTGLTPSAGSNYQCVDEDPWTTTDYVSGAAGTDLYSVSDVSGFSSVDAVQTITYSNKTDAGVRTLRTVMRSNLGTSVESADLALTTTTGVVQGPIRQLDPDSAPLTQTLVNTAQYGVKVV